MSRIICCSLVFGLFAILGGCGGSSSSSALLAVATPTPDPVISPTPTAAPLPSITPTPTATPIPPSAPSTPVPGEIVTNPIDILWFGNSSTAFPNGSWPSYSVPYLISSMYQQVSGLDELPGTILTNLRGGTVINSWLARNTCSRDSANGMHLIHGTEARYESGCNSGAHNNQSIYGDQTGDGIWEYVVASTVFGMPVDLDAENGALEQPRNASEAVYRLLKEIHDYNENTNAQTKLLNYTLARDDDNLNPSGGNSGTVAALFERLECIISVAQEYGQSMESLPVGLSFYYLYRAIDTVNLAQDRLDVRSLYTGVPFEIEGVQTPTYIPIFNFDSRDNPNSNTHLSSHGAILTAMTIVYYIYNVDPTLIVMPSELSAAGPGCNGGDDLCNVSAEQYEFLQRIAKFSVDTYRAGDGRVSCTGNGRREIDSFVSINPQIDDFDSDFGLDNTYLDATGDGYCSLNEDCSRVLFPLAEDFE